MNENDQRIAIAEACGWKMYCQEAIGGNWRSKDSWITAPDGTSQFRHDIPDYLHDLNAMHEAESTLPPRHEQYAIALAELVECNEEGELNPWDLWKVSRATAAQRAEAFLRAIGKWSSG